MLDPYKIVEKLSALEEKILEKYTLEEVEKLYKVLDENDYPRAEFALRSFSPDFPLKNILSKKEFSDDPERNYLFFQWIVLSLVLEVFRAAESFYPGISEYEMLQLAGKRINDLVWEEFWPFSDLMEDPKKSRKNRQQQSHESMPG